MTDDYSQLSPEQRSIVGRMIGGCLKNRLIVVLVTLAVIAWGVLVAPFDWATGPLTRDPVPVDAIPDIGENQQIIFTEWPGRSPQDVEDQITYPLTSALLGVPKVKTVRSYSMFGFSTIYVIFEERAEFYWSRSRLLEKLNSPAATSLPKGVQPVLGPDATALGQIFWYTLEGRDPDGRPAGGWDLEELRGVQDWQVRYHLMSAKGVSEVASVGGFVREYQIDVDPDAMRAHGVTLPEIYQAVRASNIDVGARTIEVNRVEYVIRGVGFLKNVSDIENSVVKRLADNVPILVRHVATVTQGPALRRGVLDKDGAEAVGGVVVARYGDNPLAAINNVKGVIRRIAPGLPAKAVIDTDNVAREQVRAYAHAAGFEAYDGEALNQPAWLEHLEATPREQWPAWVTRSKVTIVPFYDRTGLIYETLGTLEDALTGEILITLIVVTIMVLHLRSSALIGGMLPLAVLLCFVAMKTFGVDANVVALSGIAIAIGTIVDMGIVICENTLRHLDRAPPDAPRLAVVHRAACEVGSAVLTAGATTIVSFLPVFTMSGAEGKLFRPLAFTKTFALAASIVIALTLLPAAAHMLFRGRVRGKVLRGALFGMVAAAGLALAAHGVVAGSGLIVFAGLILAAMGLYSAIEDALGETVNRWAKVAKHLVIVLYVAVLLTVHWEPFGPGEGLILNFLLVAVLVGGFLAVFLLFQRVYPWILRLCLAFKPVFLGAVALVLVAGAIAWSGMGSEFMPPLDEGSFLYMPTTMVHASIGEAHDVLAKQDRAFAAVPEIDSAVGKIGRADTPLDPAPISMVETVINYKSEYITDKGGRVMRFRWDDSAADFQRDAAGLLIPDDDGRPFRQWREHIRTPDDIWKEIVTAGEIPGSTSAPRLQPIAARIVMLQSGMRAPMGVRIKGPDLKTIDRVALRIEQLLKRVDGVEASTVIADRIVGKPYLEIVPDREALGRYGVMMDEFQHVIEVGLGGRRITSTVQGRERYGVRARYKRELRDSEQAIRRILVPGKGGTQVPLEQVARLRYVRGPQVIKSEQTFLIGYVLFDKITGAAEVDVVKRARAYLEANLTEDELRGVTYEFAGSYENQLRAQRTLMIVLPLALLVIFLVLYLQFHKVSTALLIFLGILVAWAGGFILLGLYGTDWFMNLDVFGRNLRDVFNIDTVNLSVAVWVGFLALFGIATDDGVVMATYLEQSFRDRGGKPGSTGEIREMTVAAGRRRVRPCLMTTATTILALLPVLTSRGRGSDVMGPMAIPIFGGMCVEVLTMLVVPVLYCLIREVRSKRAAKP